MRHLLVISLILLNCSSAHAKDWSVDVGMGSNFDIRAPLPAPYFHLALNYKLPILKQQTALFVDYTFYNASRDISGLTQFALLGGKYYFTDSLFNSFQVFGSLSTGAYFSWGGIPSPNDGPKLLNIPILAGLGTDYMFTPHFGASAHLQFGPLLGQTMVVMLRPDINLKFAF